jgi:hypothetical protein
MGSDLMHKSSVSGQPPFVALIPMIAQFAVTSG